MQKLFENWRKFLEQQEPGETISRMYNEDRPYAVHIPKTLDKNKPVNVVLYFHGKYTKMSFNHEEMLRKLIPHIPKKENAILVVPYLGVNPQRTPTLSKGFLGDLASSLASDYSFEIGNIDMFAHSAGGKVMSRFLLSLNDQELTKITATYLDATYGYPATDAVARRFKKLGLIGNLQIFTAGRGKTQRNAKRFKKYGIDVISRPELKHKDLEIPPKGQN